MNEPKTTIEGRLLNIGDSSTCSLCGGKKFAEDETPWGIRESPCPDCQPGGICGGCGGYDPTIDAGNLCNVCMDLQEEYEADYSERFTKEND